MLSYHENIWGYRHNLPEFPLYRCWFSDGKGVEIDIEGIFDIHSEVMFKYKLSRKSDEIIFGVAASSYPRNEKYIQYIGPICKIIFPVSVGGIIVYPDKIKEAMSKEERRTAYNYIKYVILNYNKYRFSVPPYPEEVSFKDYSEFLK